MRWSHHFRALPAPSAAERQLPLTPMIDVALLLVISILCTTTARRVEGVIDISQSSWVWTWCPALPSVEVELRLIDPSARERPDRTLEYRVGVLCTNERKDVATLLHRARTWEGFDGRLSIVAHSGVTCGEVVGVLEAARDVGFDDVRFERPSGD
jgi:biopolymer transport protein ExbD